MKIKKTITTFILLISVSYCYCQNCIDTVSMRKLYNAIINKNNESVINILSQNAKIINCEYKEELPLWNALLVGDVQIVNSLLNYGADIGLSLITAHSNELLFITAIENLSDKATLELVISQATKKGIIDKQDNYSLQSGRTAFNAACRKRNFLAIELLLKCNCNVNITDDKGNDGLMTLLEMPAYFDGDEEALLRIIKTFIDKVEDINKKNKDNYSALKFAEKNNFLKIVSFLKMEDFKRQNKDNPDVQKKIEERQQRRR